MLKCDFNKVALLCNFIEIALRHGCSPVNLLHIFRIPFPKNTSGRLLLIILLVGFYSLLSGLVKRRCIPVSEQRRHQENA